MALEREKRSIGFEREDKRRRVEKRAEELGEGLAGALKGLVFAYGEEDTGKIEKAIPTPIVVVKEERTKVVAPSVALMGVSMLGSELFPLAWFSSMPDFYSL